MRTVTFGEIMLRLSPPAHGRFVQAKSLDVCYGGGEANVAVGLVQFGLEAAFVTALPAHEMGQAAVNALRGFGVDTRSILRQGDRIGIYFIENGASERASKVIYDRAGSAIAKAKASDFDWESIFQGAGWFHLSGITPAISPEMAAASLEAVRTAKGMGLTVSCDLNYRSKMWTVEEAKAVMQPLMGYVDLLIANEEHIRTILEIDTSDLPREDTNLTPAGASEAARRVNARYHIPMVALTQRRSLSASDNRFKGVLWKDGEAAFSAQHDAHRRPGRQRGRLCRRDYRRHPEGVLPPADGRLRGGRLRLQAFGRGGLPGGQRGGDPGPRRRRRVGERAAVRRCAR